MSTDDRRAISEPTDPSTASMARIPAETGEQSARDKARATADRHADMRTMVITVAILGGAVALAATAQAVIVLGIPNGFVGESVPFGWDLGRRIFINLLTVMTTLLVVSQLRIETRRPALAAALVLAAGVAVAALRAVMQIAVGIYSQRDVLPALADAAVSGSMISLIIAFAVFVTRGQQRIRRAERASLMPAAQSAQALVTLLRTQTRNRNTLASETRDTLRERFQHVMHEIAEIGADADGLVKLRLQSVQRELADVALAGRHGLALFTYPESLDHGLVPAVRGFIALVPKPIVVRLRVSDPAEVLAATGTGSVGIDRRAVLLQTVVEGILNALEFGHAQRVDITIGLAAGMVRISVTDDGAGGGGSEPPGLDSLRRQVSRIGGRLEAEVSADGGCNVVVFAPPVRAGA